MKALNVFSALFLLNVIGSSNAYQFTTPYLPWVAVIDDVDVTTVSQDDLDILTKDCFEKCLFKNKCKCTSKEFFDFVCKFDPQVDLEAIAKDEVLHPFRRDPDVPHMATREERTVGRKELGDQYRFGPVWHMDFVGSNKYNIPNVVSAFHFLETPKTGGSPIFCNLEIAYASLPLDTRKQLDTLECIYDNDFASFTQSRYNDFERLGPFSDKEELQVVKPLVHRDESTGRKRLFFTPTRFDRFVGWTREESWGLMTHVFYNYIQTPQNTANIHWDEGDIAIFNNHR